MGKALGKKKSKQYLQSDDLQSYFKFLIESYFIAFSKKMSTLLPLGLTCPKIRTASKVKYAVGKVSKKCND